MKRLAICLLALGGGGMAFLDAAEVEDLFENRVRPVLETRCITCHGPERQDGDLRLDTRGQVQAESLGRLAGGKSDAPKSCALSEKEGEAFASWIEAGLPWPEGVSIDSNQKEKWSRHWAFQPVSEPEVPAIGDAEFVRNSVDAFVLSKLRESGLDPSPEADRRTLIRRLHFTITGLPPSSSEVDRFVSSSDENAYEKLVEELLNSPHYGEHWARHWLDVARYSDSKGYIYAREERFWVHSWAYRDWVVDALNGDLPYDRFVQLQLAADQLVEPDADDLAAMGFLTLGRRFQGVERDIIDDRIDVVTRGMMGLTVGCARCHDHKYDPIPTADYYSLHGVFASSRERLVSLGGSDVGGKEFQAELAKRREALRTRFEKEWQEGTDRARSRIGDYLFAQTELGKYPANGFDQIFSKDDLLPAFVHRWDDFLKEAGKRNDPLFVPWHLYAGLPDEDFAARAAEIVFEPDSVHPDVEKIFRVPPKSMREVADRYAELFDGVEESDKGPLAAAVFGPGSPATIPDLPIVHSETFFHSGAVTELYKLEGEIYRWIRNSKVEAPQALVLEDRARPVSTPVFLRGNPLRKGELTPRQFLGVLSGDGRKPFEKGSGRLELARAIADPGNPLTARVMVNRVWGHHFGKGLVRTPSDFGLRSDPPSHPELLDWLTARFVADGWSVKKLHRTILLSSTFRQSSNHPNQEATRVDPDNRLLWRMNARRLSWEQFRDSMLSASGDLDDRIGGKPVSLFNEPYPKRRTIYGLVDRQFLPALLRTFDFANPDLHIPRRSETTVPQQALFFMNDPLVLERSRALAAHSKKASSSEEDRIRLLFRNTWQRDPSPVELAEARSLLVAAENVKPADLAPPTAPDWSYGYGAFDEGTDRVRSFARLPHFTGSAWQGGGKWPDSKLGWVQLTAEGGHPGNKRDHAAIRRWTAPAAMTISIDTELIHEPEPGDGIRAFIVSSRVGKLASATIHQDSIEMKLQSLEVVKGETIDFVVDIDEVLNSDQYLWEVTLFEASRGEDSRTWNSVADFPKKEVPQLTGWEQLAQALLCSNEFLFVD
jgi:hypothetical protein